MGLRWRLVQLRPWMQGGCGFGSHQLENQYLSDMWFDTGGTMQRRPQGCRWTTTIFITLKWKKTLQKVHLTAFGASWLRWFLAALVRRLYTRGGANPTRYSVRSATVLVSKRSWRSRTTLLVVTAWKCHHCVPPHFCLPTEVNPFFQNHQKEENIGFTEPPAAFYIYLNHSNNFPLALLLQSSPHHIGCETVHQPTPTSRHHIL